MLLVARRAATALRCRLLRLSWAALLMKAVIRAVVAVPLAAFCITGCSEAPPAPDVQFLASDAYFVVGGQRIVIPAVALRGPGHTFDLSRSRPETSLKDRLRRDAGDPGNPMKMDKLDLLIRQYQYTGEHLASLNICPQLKRAWSQSLCGGQHRGLLKRLPEQFDLLDRDRLDLLGNHWTVGRERRYDQIKDMAVQPGVPEIGCDRESRYCTAMVEVLPGLMAVWTVWSDEKTEGTAAQMAQAQGTAIVQFVRRALGPAEDPTLVNAD